MRSYSVQGISNLSYGREENRSGFRLFLFDGDPGEGLALDHQRFIGKLTHVTGKAVAATGNGGDVAWTAGAFAQRPSNRRNVHGKVRLLDNLVRPDQLKELIFGEQAPTIADQYQQHLEGFTVQR